MRTKNYEYELIIINSEWSHFVRKFNNKREAIKEASHLRRNGNFFTDSEKFKDIKNSLVIVYKNNEEIYTQPFTKKYLNYLS